MRTHRQRVVPTHFRIRLGLLIGLLAIAGCQKASKDKAAAGSNQGSGQGSAVAATGSGSATGSAGSAGVAAPVDPPKDIDSKDILARTETAPLVYVKHVLIGWKDLAGRGPGDPRAAKRTNP